MPKMEELPQGTVRKRQATPEEIKMIRELEEQTDDLSGWEEGFIKSMYDALVKAESVGLKSMVLMISEKQAEVLERISIKLANQSIDEHGFDRDDD